jgi:hypothetical protein
MAGVLMSFGGINLNLFIILDQMTTYGDGISADLSNNMQNVVADDNWCPKCQKGKLRPTYLNVDLDLIWLCSKVRS